MRFWLPGALALLPLTLTAQSTLHLIPMPREVHAKAAQPIASVHIVCSGCDSDDQFAASDLRQTLADRGLHDTAGGLTITFQRSAAGFTDAMKPEGYTIISSGNTLTLTGATAEGVFYAAQTAKQLIESIAPGQWTLNSADIKDWPAMKYRGLDDDFSRGPIDTLDFQKKVIRTIAAYKVNIYSPYFESSQQYETNPLIAPPGAGISPADARELVAYAKPFHITVIPEQEAFGHLRHALVNEQYNQLAETPHGAVLAPGQPGSVQLISQLFTELSKNYPGPFLHLGADETDDLGRGQTKEAVDRDGLGKVYLGFMQQIVDALHPLNRRLLFWGDIAQHEPALLKAMPAQFKRDTIAVAWEYNPNPNGFMPYLKPYTDAGFETWVAPGINNWSRVYPNYNNGLANIQQFTRDGQKVGSTGQLNTIWNDDGEALASNNWYGILFGAAAAWQQGESSIPQFQQSYAQVFHGDRTGLLNQAQIELMTCHDILRQSALKGDGSDLLFWSDPWAPDQQKNMAAVRPVLSQLRLHAEKAITLIAQARSASPAPNVPVVYTPTNQFPSNPTTLRETDAIDAMELGARRFDFIGLKIQLADEISLAFANAQATAATGNRRAKPSVAAYLGDINGVNGRIQDIKDGYSLLRELYEQSWRRTNKPYALRPVLEHYDYTIALWISRMDKVRTSQRLWPENHTLPSNAEIGIPAPAPAAK